MKPLSIALILIGVSACASTQSAIVDRNNLGASGYTPAVLVEPGYDEQYQRALDACRAVASNRQLTAAQEEQLSIFTDTLGGVIGGAAVGAAAAAGGGGVNAGEGALIGAGAGLVGGLVGSILTGPQEVAEETKVVLLRCLDRTSNNGERWQVLEDVEPQADYIIERRLR